MSPENVNAEQLVQIIREKVLAEEIREQRRSPDFFGRFKSLTREIAQEMSNVELPPAPPTIRGRLSGFIVRFQSGICANGGRGCRLKAYAAKMQKLFQPLVTVCLIIQQEIESQAIGSG